MKTAQANDELLSFSQDTDLSLTKERPWKLLVVDDEPEVHSVTRLALSDFNFEGRGLSFINAYSGREACEIVENDPEIAVMLLDVVMETEDAGLQVVEHVRRHLGNNFVRIILRTGHPGMAPERRVIKAYDINDYRAKTELTQDRMFSLMYTSLRAYKRMSHMAQSRRRMSALADEYKTLLDRTSAHLHEPGRDIADIAEELKKRLPREADDEELAAALSKLQQRGEELSQFSQALARLSAIDCGHSEQAEFDCNDVTDVLLTQLQTTLEQTKAQVNHSKLPVVHGNPERFSDLLEQLLLNAIRYHENSDPSIEIQAEARGKDWEFSVSDRGRGIPADQMESCFQAFSNQRYGVGLALCRRIVSEFGGRIWVEARTGGGSVFKFTVPAVGQHEYQ